MDPILFSVESGVAFITMNRPDKLNSFNRTMALQLQTILDQCANDESIRAIYLTGAGKGFCAGQDLAEVVDPAGPGMQRILSEHYNPIVQRLRDIAKPIVAAVNGVAAGAGANIAFACDVVVSKSSASFIQAFSKIGLIPDSGGTYTLPRMIGYQKALALMMTGDKISADQADAMNMIYKAVDDEAFESEVKNFAETIAALPTRGLGLTKKAVNATFTNNLTQQLALEEELQTEAGQTYDFREGVNAFLEKRKPVFKGK